MSNTEMTTRPNGATQPTTARSRTVEWYRPAVDVYEGNDGLLLFLDVPGVKPDGFEVTVEGHVLTVQGVRSHGRTGWRRAFNLPDGFDADRIEAKAENGVLRLALPRSEQHRPRRIEVK